jgi:hypothetical protein
VSGVKDDEQPDSGPQRDKDAGDMLQEMRVLLPLRLRKEM